MGGKSGLPSFEELYEDWHDQILRRLPLPWWVPREVRGSAPLDGGPPIEVQPPQPGQTLGVVVIESLGASRLLLIVAYLTEDGPQKEPPFGLKKAALSSLRAGARAAIQHLRYDEQFAGLWPGIKASDVLFDVRNLRNERVAWAGGAPTPPNAEADRSTLPEAIDGGSLGLAAYVATLSYLLQHTALDASGTSIEFAIWSVYTGEIRADGSSFVLRRVEGVRLKLGEVIAAEGRLVVPAGNRREAVAAANRTGARVHVLGTLAEALRAPPNARERIIESAAHSRWRQTQGQRFVRRVVYVGASMILLGLAAYGFFTLSEDLSRPRQRQADLKHLIERLDALEPAGLDAQRAAVEIEAERGLTRLGDPDYAALVRLTWAERVQHSVPAEAGASLSTAYREASDRALQERILVAMGLHGWASWRPHVTGAVADAFERRGGGNTELRAGALELGGLARWSPRAGHPRDAHDMRLGCGGASGGDETLRALQSTLPPPEFDSVLRHLASAIELQGAGDHVRSADLDGDGRDELVSWRDGAVLMWRFELGVMSRVSLGPGDAELETDATPSLSFARRDDGPDLLVYRESVEETREARARALALSSDGRGLTPVSDSWETSHVNGAAFLALPEESAPRLLIGEGPYTRRVRVLSPRASDASPVGTYWGLVEDGDPFEALGTVRSDVNDIMVAPEPLGGVLISHGEWGDYAVRHVLVEGWERPMRPLWRYRLGATREIAVLDGEERAPLLAVSKSQKSPAPSAFPEGCRYGAPPGLYLFTWEETWRPHHFIAAPRPLGHSFAEERCDPKWIQGAFRESPDFQAEIEGPVAKELDISGLLPADLDGDGDDDLVASVTLSGALPALWMILDPHDETPLHFYLPGLNVVAATQLDEDAADELVVQHPAAGHLILGMEGAADAAGLVIPAALVPAPLADPLHVPTARSVRASRGSRALLVKRLLEQAAPKDPALGEVWERARTFSDVGDWANAGAMFKLAVETAAPGDTRVAGLLLAGLHFEAGERPEDARAAYCGVLVEQGGGESARLPTACLGAGAAERGRSGEVGLAWAPIHEIATLGVVRTGVQETGQALSLGWAEMAEVLESLAEQHDTAERAALIREAVDALRALADWTALVERPEEVRAPPWKSPDPSLFEDTSRPAMRFAGVERSLTGVPIQWSGEALLLEAVFEVKELEWGSRYDVALVRPGTEGIGRRLLDIQVHAAGGGGALHRGASCDVPTEGRGPIESLWPVDGPKAHEEIRVRLIALPRLGRIQCEVTNLTGGSEGELRSWTAEPARQLWDETDESWLLDGPLELQLIGGSGPATNARSRVRLTELRIEGVRLGVAKGSDAPADAISEDLLLAWRSTEQKQTPPEEVVSRLRDQALHDTAGVPVWLSSPDRAPPTAQRVAEWVRLDNGRLRDLAGEVLGERGLAWALIWHAYALADQNNGGAVEALEALDDPVFTLIEDDPAIEYYRQLVRASALRGVDRYGDAAAASQAAIEAALSARGGEWEPTRGALGRLRTTRLQDLVRVGEGESALSALEALLDDPTVAPEIVCDRLSESPTVRRWAETDSRWRAALGRCGR